MKSLLIACALLFFPVKAQVLNVGQVEKLLDYSVLIRIKVYSTNPKTLITRRGVGGCSGTYISDSTILSAAHCFSYPTTDIWIRGNDKKTYTAKLLKIDPANDLALLGVINKGPHIYARLAKTVRKGEGVFNVGSPFSFEFLISEGLVAATNVVAKPFKASYTVTTAMINPGSSGGGAFNVNGELIGVNTLTVGGFFGWAGISMAVDLKTIRTFLQ